MKRTTRGRDHEVSAGNVFADLGLPGAEELLAKAKLVSEIVHIIDRLGLTQAEAARRLKIDQPKVSALLNGKLGGFSTERLIRFLNALDQDVEIVVRPKPPRRAARLRVTARQAA